MKVIARLTENLTNSVHYFYIVPASVTFPIGIRPRHHVGNMNVASTVEPPDGRLQVVCMYGIKASLRNATAAHHRESRHFIDKILFYRLRLAVVWGHRTGDIRRMLIRAPA